MEETLQNKNQENETEIFEFEINNEKKLTIYEKGDKWLDIQLKVLSLQEKKEQLRIEKIRHNQYLRDQAINALQTISFAVHGAFIIDSERTVFATEPFMKNLYEPHELKIIKKKVLEIISIL